MMWIIPLKHLLINLNKLFYLFSFLVRSCGVFTGFFFKVAVFRSLLPRKWSRHFSQCSSVTFREALYFSAVHCKVKWVQVWWHAPVIHFRRYADPISVGVNCQQSLSRWVNCVTTCNPALVEEADKILVPDWDQTTNVGLN